MAEGREHYDEINALVGAIAKALGLPDKDVAAEIESGAIVLGMGEDDNGNRYIEVRRGDVTAQVYQGAIRHAPDTAPGRD
ncbi:hypothetical protein ACM64Y_04625 [Novispirillum sp. DQ9]|uniref:hypothetical protein n=1 Tax=Novispirillum sp. DQ9 TaxID=3398612 RepID=UPI003C7D25BB